MLVVIVCSVVVETDSLVYSFEVVEGTSSVDETRSLDVVEAVAVVFIPVVVFDFKKRGARRTKSPKYCQNLVKV